MTTMNISVPDEIKAFIESQLATDGFASASKYLRSLIRDAQRRQAKRELEAKLSEALEKCSRHANDTRGLGGLASGSDRRNTR